MAALRPETFNPHWPMVAPDAVRAAERGLALSCWTVDDPEQMVALIELGVDAMITNRIAELGRVWP